MRNRKYDIEKYLRGELSPAEMHALEKEALSDPFLAEALEGIEQAGADNFLYDLHKINRSVHDRMKRKSQGGKVLHIWGWTSAIAATILLLAVSGFLVLNILKDQQARQQSMTTDSQVPTTKPLTDSVTVTEEDTSTAPVISEETTDRPRRQQRAQAQQEVTANDTDRVQTEIADAGPTDPTTRETIAGELQQSPPPIVREDQIAQHSDDAQQARKQQEADERIRNRQAVSRALEGEAAGVQAKRQAPAAALQVPPEEIIPVSGKVTDENGQDLPGVSVVVQGTEIGTVTDGEGKYSIEVPVKDATLVFAFIGYESKQVPVDEKAELNITLEEDITTLSEVVVVGYEEKREGVTSFMAAEPDGGKNAFKDYLTTAVKYPQEAIKNKTEGKVTIRFTVEPTGQLTNFEVLKGIGSRCEEELIRAVRQGPDWKPGKVGNQPVRDKVRVRYKFELPK